MKICLSSLAGGRAIDTTKGTRFRVPFVVNSYYSTAYFVLAALCNSVTVIFPFSSAISLANV